MPQALKLPLRSVLVWSFALLIAITGLVTSYLTLHDRQIAVNQLATAWHRETTTRVVRFLDANLTKPRLIATIAQEDQQAGFFEMGDLDAIDRYLFKRLGAIDFISSLAYGDARNNLRAASRLGFLQKLASDPGDRQTISCFELNADGQLVRLVRKFRQSIVTDRPWYRDTASVGKPTWNPIFRLESGVDFSLSFSVPIYDRQQALQGVISASTALSFVDRFLYNLELGEAGQIFILERSGLLVGSSSDAPPFRSIQQNGQPILERIPATESQNERLKATSRQILQQFGDLGRITQPQQFVFNWQRSPQRVQIVPYQDGFGLDWLIVNSVPEATLLLPGTHTEGKTILLYVIAVAGAIALSSLIAREIARPIVQLSRASHALAIGEWQTSVPKTSAIAEIHTLAASYQQMAIQLQQSFEQVQATLSNTEAKFAKVFEASPDVITISTLKDGRFLEVSESFLEVSGYGRDEVIGRTSIELGIWADTRDRQQLLQMLLLRETHSFEHEFQTRSGDRIPFLTSLERIQIDGQTCILAIGKDIRDRKQMEAALRESEAALVQAQRVAHIGSWMYDLESGQLAWSEELFRICGLDSSLGVPTFGEQLERWLHPHDAQLIKMLAQRSIEQGEAYQCDLRWRRSDGTMRVIEARGEPVTDATGRVVRLVGTGLDITDRKNIEAALQAQRAYLRQVIDAIPSNLFVKDGEGRFLLVNQAIAANYGVPESEILGKTAGDFARSRHLQAKFAAENREIMTSGKPQIFEQMLPTANGEQRWYQVVISPFRDADGQTQGIIGVSIDISDRKQIETELEAQRTYLQQIIEIVPSALFVKDTEGRFLLANQAAAAIHGYAVEEMIGKTILEITGDRSLHKQYQASNQVVMHSGQTKTIIEEEIVDLTGQRRWYQTLIRPFVDRDGQVQGIIGASVDVSDRKQIELELEAQRAYLGQVLDVAPCYLFVKDLEGRYLLVNQMAATLHHSPIAEIIGKTIADLTPALTEEYAAIDREVITSGKTKIIPEETIQTATGEQRWFQTLISPFTDTNGQVQGVVGASIDITELRQTREAAEAANRAKSEFLANMSHELRTPLNAILGFTQLMSQDADITPTQQDYLDIINSSGEHLLQLINDVLSIAKIEAGQSTLSETSFDLFDLLDNLESLLRLRAESKGLRLTCDRAPTVPQFIIADAGKLRQVLINLVGNAIKFTETGNVTVRVGVRDQGLGVRETADPQPLTPNPQSLLLRFEIEDTGIGIPEREFDRIFEPFVQADASGQQGTGLGLAICRRFAQQMGGTIQVSSTIAQGSLFMVELPCQLAAPVVELVEAQRVVAIASDQPTYRILVVDDTLANRQLLLRWLEPIGFAVQVAESGEQAIELCAEFAPDLIWMDMRMPGIDGYEATRQIRQSSEVQPKIIAITAIVFEEERQRILAAGCDDFVGKPCTEAIVLEKIRVHLGVRYQYAADRDAADRVAIDPAANLNADLISRMPIDWIRKLDFAARSANDAQIMQLLEQVPSEQIQLKQAIAHLVHEFQLERLLRVTQPICDQVTG